MGGWADEKVETQKGRGKAPPVFQDLGSRVPHRTSNAQSPKIVGQAGGRSRQTHPGRPRSTTPLVSKSSKSSAPRSGILFSIYTYATPCRAMPCHASACHSRQSTSRPVNQTRPDSIRLNQTQSDSTRLNQSLGSEIVCGLRADRQNRETRQENTWYGYLFGLHAGVA